MRPVVTLSVLRRGDAGEALVVAEVEIGLRAVVGDVDLAVLIRAHRARIDVEIGVELAQPHLEAARLQQRAERRRRQTLAERGDHAAGDEDEPRHGPTLWNESGATQQGNNLLWDHPSRIDRKPLGGRDLIPRRHRWSRWLCRRGLRRRSAAGCRSAVRRSSRRRSSCCGRRSGCPVVRGHDLARRRVVGADPRQRSG